MSADVLRRFDRTDAEAQHGHLVTYDEANGQTFGECEVHGERCWTFGFYTDTASLEQTFLEHAATAVGVCWLCSGPASGRWTNRERCRRCWVMYHAEEKELLPRDCPPFPSGSDDSQEA